MYSSAQRPEDSPEYRKGTFTLKKQHKKKSDYKKLDIYERFNI